MTGQPAKGVLVPFPTTTRSEKWASAFLDGETPPGEYTDMTNQEVVDALRAVVGRSDLRDNVTILLDLAADRLYGACARLNQASQESCP